MKTFTNNLNKSTTRNRNFVALFLVAFLFLTGSVQAQNDDNSFGGEVTIHEHHDHDHSKCVSDVDRKAIFAEVEKSVEDLRARGILQEVNSRSGVSFRWPLKKSSSLNSRTNWGRSYGVSNFVDHNDGAGLTDYACGSHTYDGHDGTDIYTYPFSWYLMENDLVNIVAAESGQIIYKNDGNHSYSCSFGGNTAWNAVYIQHADGSIAWYGHMKQNSLTTKAVGSHVSKGEFLGVVGSSGYSTGPHLHFEVYSGLPYSASNLIDPFKGGCNGISDSYFDSQRSYKEPRVNAIFTHATPPQLGQCSHEEETNFKNEFDPGERIYFTRFFTDQKFNTTSNHKILRPDGSVWKNWNHSSPNTYTSSYWYNYYDMPAAGPFGTWTYQVTYQGQTLTHKFKYGQTGCGTPNKPVVTHKTHNSVTLDWPNVNNAQSYNVYRWNGASWVYHSIAYTSDYKVTGLSANTSYYFRVTATCNVTEGAASLYVKATTNHLATCNAPNRPTVTNLKPTSLTLNWNSVAGANSYDVYYWNGTAWAFITNRTTTNVNIVSLVPGKKYYFAVRTKCGYGNSPISSYRTITTPYQVTCGTPNRPSATQITTTTVQLTWNAVSGATKYNLYYWNGSSYEKFGSSTNTTQKVTGLSPNSTYYFTISAVCSHGESTLSSSRKVVTLHHVTCGTPGTPWVTNLQSTSCKLNWNAVSGATTYELFYWTGTAWSKFGTHNGTSHTITGLTANTTYYFAIKAKCASGLSNLSNYVTCKTTTGYTCGKPTGFYAYDVQGHSLKLDWIGVSGASYYDVYWWKNSAWVKLGDVTNSHATVTGLASNTTYYFSIRAVCGGTAGAFTDYITVKTAYTLVGDDSDTNLIDNDNSNGFVSTPSLEEMTKDAEVADEVEASTIQEVQTRSAEVVATNEVTKVYPTLLTTSDNIRVELTSNNDATTMVQMISINGSIVSQEMHKVQKGENTLEMASPFDQGTYILTIIFEDGKRVNKKIVVN